MGLDITVHPEIRVLDPHTCTDEDACYEAGHTHTYVYTCFENSFRGLPVLERDGETVSGFSHGSWVEDVAETWSFRAGSYSGYNAFRSSLQEAAWGEDVEMDWDAYEIAKDPKWMSMPFIELIAFADNEGVIGPDACADLRWDFTAYEDEVLARLDPGWHDKYQTWKKAFEDTAWHGMVEFH